MFTFEVPRFRPLRRFYILLEVISAQFLKFVKKEEEGKVNESMNDRKDNMTVLLFFIGRRTMIRNWISSEFGVKFDSTVLN